MTSVQRPVLVPYIPHVGNVPVTPARRQALELGRPLVLAIHGTHEQPDAGADLAVLGLKVVGLRPWGGMGAEITQILAVVYVEAGIERGMEAD